MKCPGFAFTALLSMFNTIFDGRVVAKLPFTPIYWIQVLKEFYQFDWQVLTNWSVLGAEPQKPAGRWHDWLQLHLPLHPLHHVHQVIFCACLLGCNNWISFRPLNLSPGKTFRKRWALHPPGQPASRQVPCGTQTPINTSGTRVENPKLELEEIGS